MDKNFKDSLDFDLLGYIRESDLIEGIDYSLEQIERSYEDEGGYPYNHAVAFSILYEDPTEANLLKAFNRLLPKVATNHTPYRVYEVTIGGRFGFSPASLNEAMADLFSREVGTLQDACDFHIHFELIHPFGDGNGRTGRVVMNSQLHKIGHPMVIIPAERRFEYYDFIQYGDVESFVKFIEGLVRE